MKKYIIIFIFVLLILIPVFAYDLNNENNKFGKTLMQPYNKLIDYKSQKKRGPVVFKMGTTTVEKTVLISTNGGSISVDNPNSPIYGIKVEFPGGALPQNTNVTIGYNTGTINPNQGVYSGINLYLNTPNVSVFNQPVKITVPYNDPLGTAVPCPYYIQEDGSISPVFLLDINHQNKTFTFITFHGTSDLYTWIIDQPQ